MNVYIASSWRNEYQPQAVEELERLGHSVYDFRNPPHETDFHWSQVSRQYKYWSTNDYVAALDHPIARAGYHTDKQAMDNADCCLLVMPAGRSACFEAGYLFAKTKRLYVLLLEAIEPELMFREAVFLLSWEQLRSTFKIKP